MVKTCGTCEHCEIVISRNSEIFGCGAIGPASLSTRYVVPTYPEGMTRETECLDLYRRYKNGNPKVEDLRTPQS